MNVSRYPFPHSPLQRSGNGNGKRLALPLRPDRATLPASSLSRRPTIESRLSARRCLIRFFYDDQACRLTSGIERSIVRLRLESQGEFVALINAIQMQLESGDPVPRVVRLLGDALIELAQAKGASNEQLRLQEGLATVVERIERHGQKARGR
jgi:hypothetical protein